MDQDSPARDRVNSAVGLRAFLDGVAARVRSVPSAWVRCELLALKDTGKFVRMEFIEHGSDGQKLAQAGGGCWPGVYRHIAEAFAAVGLRLEAGSKVLVKLKPQFDANYGFSVEVEDIDPSYSLGDLKAKAEAIRNRLKDMGCWNQNRRLRQPRDFLRVAVISPAGAAGLGDFRASVERLTAAGLVEFAFHEAQFQTPAAASQIVDRLRLVWRDHKATPFCALAIIRGGGAAADLAYLIDEKLTEAVCKMPMPVITGIGHERDRNLLDEVACVPLDTPSKVAEHIRTTVTGAAQAADRALAEIRSQTLLTVAHYAKGITAVETAIGKGVRQTLLTAERSIRTAVENLKPDARASLDTARDAVADAGAAVLMAARARRDAARGGLAMEQAETSRLARTHLLACERQTSRVLSSVTEAPPRLLETASRETRDRLSEAIRSACTTFDEAERGVERAITRAEALDPSTVLAAGYAILRGPDGAPLSSAALVAQVPEVRADMRDGSITLWPDTATSQSRRMHHSVSAAGDPTQETTTP